MARLEMTTKLSHADVTAMVDEATRELGFKGVAKFLERPEPQVKITGAKDGLLKLQRAFETKGHQSTIYD